VTEIGVSAAGEVCVSQVDAVFPANLLSFGDLRSLGDFLAAGSFFSLGGFARDASCSGFSAG
jgi:hypothetical protein